MNSADYMQGTRMNFRSKEDAVHFAEKQGASMRSRHALRRRILIREPAGWDYYVQQTEVKRVPPKNYAENYLYRPGKLRIAKTK